MSGVPRPNDAVQIWLACIAVHADEAISGNGHEFDIEAIRGLLDLPGMRAYLDELGALGLTPVKR